MLLIPYESEKMIEYDYAIIDPNLNADYFYDLESSLISLAPDYAKNIQHVFPYLIHLNNIDAELKNEILEFDKEKIENNYFPFFLFKFKSFPTREPDIVNHLKENLVYELDGKKVLYRFYDPRVWMNLNYFSSRDFLWLNKYFNEVELGFFCKNYKFLNKNIESYFVKNDQDLLERIGISNRTLDILKYKMFDLDQYFSTVSVLSEYIHLAKENEVYLKNDLIATIFHVELIGKYFFESELFQNLKNNSKGYEQASKELSTKDWEVFFNNHKIFDEKLKNKVMYEY